MGDAGFRPEFELSWASGTLPAYMLLPPVSRKGAARPPGSVMEAM